MDCVCLLCLPRLTCLQSWGSHKELGTGCPDVEPGSGCPDVDLGSGSPDVLIHVSEVEESLGEIQVLILVNPVYLGDS